MGPRHDPTVAEHLLAEPATPDLPPGRGDDLAPWHTRYQQQDRTPERGDGQGEKAAKGLTVSDVFPEKVQDRISGEVAARAGHAKAIREKIAHAEAHDAELRHDESVAALGARLAEEKRQLEALAEQKKIALMLLMMSEL